MTDHTLRFRTERFKAFVDAVVAIAMTLLILPLMESVSDAASNRLSTAEFFDEHSGQLLSFGLSFVLIATFWMGHHRQYRDVEWITSPLLWINIAWMATIVWLPVPTAMIGQMDTDLLQPVVYIGTLILTQVTTLAGWVFLLRHPDLTTTPVETLRAGVIGDLAAIILFLVALAIAVFVQPYGYAGLLVLLLSGVVTQLLDRVARRRTTAN
ncbi:putative membrane protein [Microbacterium phyllosphaerae]|uniref:Membrane protein n=1 Tax=Microbacterium phyllosphaerae TaxID=124798 RepID=A0ABS4WN57_9MICO|nr:TMEM175 family protein [Microbacterium phyllosphaerae]MBP2377637.1 putative membrane protein [Microbacterium phyllosphaerae]